MYTAEAQHSISRLSLWRPAPREKVLLCVNVAGPGWASPEKRSRPVHGWKGRPRSWQRSARWYQAFCFFSAGTRRSLVPHTKTKISRTHTDTHGRIFFLGCTRYQLETRFARIITLLNILVSCRGCEAVLFPLSKRLPPGSCQPCRGYHAKFIPVHCNKCYIQQYSWRY